MAARAKPAVDRKTLYLLGGLAALVAVAVVVMRRRSSSAGVDFSQSPSVRPAGSGYGGSSAPDAPGGAGSIPGNLPGDSILEPPGGGTSGADSGGSYSRIGPTDPYGGGSSGSTGAGTASAVLSPVGQTAPHAYGSGIIYGQGGPVVDAGPSLSSPTSTAPILHPVGGGPQV